MIELVLVCVIAGLIILWQFGIKPELEKHVNNEKTIKGHYFDKSNN